MRSVADPAPGKKAKPALPSVFALGLASCSLAVGVLANVEPATVLLRSAIALVIGGIVGKLYCAVSEVAYVSGVNQGSIEPSSRVPESSADPN